MILLIERYVIFSIDNSNDPFLQHVSLQLHDRFGDDYAGAWQTLPNVREIIVRREASLRRRYVKIILGYWDVRMRGRSTNLSRCVPSGRRTSANFTWSTYS